MPSLLALLLVSAVLLSSSAQPEPDEFYLDGFDGVDTVNLYGTANRMSGGIVRLTDATPRRTAHLLYSSPVRFKDPESGGVRSFSTAFTFSIVPEFQKLGGHGIAFTVSPTEYHYWTTLPSQYFGLFNASTMGNLSNHILAIEFDSVRDFEFSDIDDNHVGIDLNSLNSTFSAPAAYFTKSGKKVSLDLKSGVTLQAWVDFDSVTSTLNVSISPSNLKPKIPLMSHKINLSLILEDSMSIGFSCATGLLASSHYLLGWSFNTSGPARSLPMTKVDSTNSHFSLIIILPISLFSGVVLLVVVTLYLIRRIRDADRIEAWERTIGPHRYSYKELNIATKGFSDKELLGRGGFGRVYKGILPKTKTLVAVKRVSQESRQGLREFMAEIATIGRVRHRNVAQLLGWCRCRNDLMLVYEYMPRGSLDKYLFDQQAMVLTWEQRFNIIKGVASGLFYLHEGWEQVVIHRDVKSSNVLLDSVLNGRLGDFGLARVHDHGANPATTKLMGTLGYLAPELSKTGKATTCTDVFAFGVLLLEVVCGRRPVDPRAPQEEVVLLECVWDKWVEGTITSVVDPRLGGYFDEEEVTMVLKLGLMCSFEAPLARPNMRQVVSYLTGEMEVPEVLEPLNVEGSMGFSHSFRSSEFEAMSSNLWSNGEVLYSVDADHEHVSSPTPLLFSSDHITSERQSLQA